MAANMVAQTLKCVAKKQKAWARAPVKQDEGQSRVRNCASRRRRYLALDDLLSHGMSDPDALDGARSPP